MAKNHDAQTLEDLFLRDPESDKRMEIVSAIETTPDGSNSFIVQEKGKRDGNRWRHTFKTEELGPNES